MIIPPGRCTLALLLLSLLHSHARQVLLPGGAAGHGPDLEVQGPAGGAEQSEQPWARALLEEKAAARVPLQQEPAAGAAAQPEPTKPEAAQAQADQPAATKPEVAAQAAAQVQPAAAKPDAAAQAAAQAQPAAAEPKVAAQGAAQAQPAGGEQAGAAAAAAAMQPAAAEQVPEPYTVAVPQQGPEAYVAICAAVKDQHIDVREWIFYHRAVGINKFYLTDTGSKPPMQAVLQDYIDTSLVEYTFDTKVPHRKGTHGPQVTVYERCLQQHGHRHTFMAFIDVDEFLILRDGTPNMPTLLKDYEQYGGLAVNWVMFGSSGVQKRPAGNTLINYWKCAPEQHPENCHIKSIVRPPHVNDSTTDPHHFKYNPGLSAVNTRREVVKGPKSANVTIDRVGLYHYSIKSVEDFQLKMARGSGMGNQKTMAYLYYIDNFTTADCLDAIDVGVQLAGFAVY